MLKRKLKSGGLIYIGESALCVSMLDGCYTDITIITDPFISFS